MQDLAPEKGGGKVNALFYKAYQDKKGIKTGLDKCTDIQNVVFSDTAMEPRLLSWQPNTCS